MKKRVFANPVQLHPAKEGSQCTIIPEFTDVMTGAVYQFVDPLACVPITKIRGLSESGVKRLMAVLDVRLSQLNDVMSIGVSLGTDTPILVKLTGTLMEFVEKHFRDEGLTKNEISLKIKGRKEWFGIIDGRHVHSAIITLINTYERWKSFRWFVTVLKGGNSMERYKQLARWQNERKKPVFHVESTFFDKISNIRAEYERLKLLHRSVTGVDVARAFCGSTSLLDKQLRTLTQTATTVMRLPRSVIATIGRVTNADHPDICLSSPLLNKKKAKTVEEVMHSTDCRVYREFINITSLKSSKMFMNAKGTDGERAQALTILRAKVVCYEKGFKSVQHDAISRQFQLATDAIEEETKFLRFLFPESWPVEMEQMKTNLLETTLFDDELESNRGNATLLPCLSAAYRRHYPLVAPVKEAKMKRNLIDLEKKEEKPEKDKACGEKRKQEILDENHSSSDSISNLKNDNKNTISVKTTVAPSEATYISEKPTEMLDEGLNIPNDSATPVLNDSNTFLDDTLIEQRSIDQNACITRFGISFYNMRWQTYLKEIWNESNGRYDLVLTEPPSAFSRS